jgi:hypothetical protein
MDSILRNSQHEEPVIQQVVQAQGYRQGPQFGLPGPYQNRSFTGVVQAQRTFQPFMVMKNLVCKSAMMK